MLSTANWNKKLQEAAPAHLTDLLKTVDPPKRRIILQRMAVHLIPIMEKALIDPVLAHRSPHTPVLHNNSNSSPYQSIPRRLEPPSPVAEHMTSRLWLRALT